MALPIEDYGIIGDLHTVALVGRDGSIDWLCLPRFDSGACFARLLGTDDHGSWRISPRGANRATHRHYRGDTLVLESEFVTDEGTVRIIDCMPIRQEHPEVIRLVEGVRGKVAMEMQLTIRFGYGQVVPWVRRTDGTLSAVAGPDALSLWTTVPTHGSDLSTVAEFTVSEGQTFPFSLSWYPANKTPPRPVDARYAIADTEQWWTEWAAQCTYDGEYREAVVRSLITLKALTYEPTGGIVAAPTTSLPETLGGGRNWDYRYCWLRDATLTLESLMRGGFYQEAMAWRTWLLRATAGDPSQMQIMYGAAGERRLDEWEVDWLPGYEGSSPVRIGNAAAGQFQLDVYGEVMSALYESVHPDDPDNGPAWELQLSLMDFLEAGWREPDDGIWEVRGPRRHFTHSKVMAWVAIDRAIRTVEEHGVDGPVERWRTIRQEIHDQVCDLGFNAEKGCFTQYYGSDQLDASLLMIPLVGFLPATDPRVRSTVEAIERELVEGDFVLRYRTVDTGEVDGLTGREGAFLACSFWLADCLTLMGRTQDARRLLDRLLDLRNDLGLLSEEYDPVAGRLVGNFPQAFSHVSLVNSAAKVGGHEKPTADHVFLGLARQAITRSHGPRGGRHLTAPGDPALRNLVAKVTKPPGRARPTSRVGGTTSAGKKGGRPARKAMTRDPVVTPTAAGRAVTEKAPARKVPKAAPTTRAGTAAPTKKAAKKKAAPRRADATTKAPGGKVPQAAEAPAEEATATKTTTKKSTATKATAKRAPAKKTTAKSAR
jgi:GH15 family glucan-1,4-alpha-glucosidase